MSYKQELWCGCGARTVIEARDSLEAYPARAAWQDEHKGHVAPAAPGDGALPPRGEA